MQTPYNGTFTYKLSPQVTPWELDRCWRHNNPCQNLVGRDEKIGNQGQWQRSFCRGLSSSVREIRNFKDQKCRWPVVNLIFWIQRLSFSQFDSCRRCPSSIKAFQFKGRILRSFRQIKTFIKAYPHQKGHRNDYNRWKHVLNAQFQKKVYGSR